MIWVFESDGNSSKLNEISRYWATCGGMGRICATCHVEILEGKDGLVKQPIQNWTIGKPAEISFPTSRLS